MSAYGEAALDREYSELARTIAGRNDRLYSAARALGQLASAGEIDRAKAERALFYAAVDCGYVAQDGAGAARATIKSGLDNGALRPRRIKRDARRTSRDPAARSSRNPELPTADPCAAPDDAASSRAKAQRLWRRREPIVSSVAERYLRTARGYGGTIPPTLAFLPARGDHPPALIASFGIATEPEPGALAIADDAVMAVQLVKLLPDGRGKADCEPNKVIIGKGALSSPIVCAPPNDLLGLAICEGIENALSVFEATDLGAWASGGATRMRALADAVPSYIECVTVFGDDDDAGRRHAPDLAARLRARGFEVILKFLRAGSAT